MENKIHYFIIYNLITKQKPYKHLIQIKNVKHLKISINIILHLKLFIPLFIIFFN